MPPKRSRAMVARLEWPLCAWGWNDQNPLSRSTNGHLAEATKTYYARFDAAIVLMIPLCEEHYAEVVKAGRWLMVDPRTLHPAEVRSLMSR